MKTASAVQRRSERNETFDVTRGLCVLAMGVHHSINYFPGYTLSYWRFVSGAFPFLAGYLVTSMLLSRACGDKARNELGLRLLWRAVKLIAICISLNIVPKLIWPSQSTKGQVTSPFWFMWNVIISGDYTT